MDERTMNMLVRRHDTIRTQNFFSTIKFISFFTFQFTLITLRLM